MTPAERIDFVDNLVNLVENNGYRGTVPSNDQEVVWGILIINEFAQSIWPIGWKTKQQELLKFSQENDYDGAIRYIADKI